MLEVELSRDSLQAELRQLRQTVAELTEEKQDLEILLETTTAHATDMENELSERNDEISGYIRALRRELEVGRKIQSDFLPDTLPRLGGYEVAAHFKPARQVAGDFYDVFVLPGNQLALVIADVCDKGVGAALFMSLTRSLLRVLAQQASARLPYTSSLAGTKLLVELPPLSVGEAPLVVPANTVEILNSVRLANDYIAATHSRANMFATLFFAVLEVESGLLYYVNGGHDAPALLGAEGVRERLRVSGPAVGMIPGAKYKIKRAQMEPGDFLLAYTDGITEARNTQDVLFTERRLLEFLSRKSGQADLTATGLLDELQTAVERHVDGADPSDDITTLAVRRNRVV